MSQCSNSPLPVLQDEPLYTRREIVQQPLLWPTTLLRVQDASERLGLAKMLNGTRVLLTGAGSSAYAASSVASAWPRSIAVPTTDLLVDPDRYLREIDVVVSLARSGNSPESVAVVDLIRHTRPEILQLAITCNADGALARSGLTGLIVLDPRTNDRSLVMTSSFSNMVLAGLRLAEADDLLVSVEQAIASMHLLLPAIEEKCRHVAARTNERIVVLASSPLLGWAAEAGLKVLEMTGGRFPMIAETYLGLRHGPMSFVRGDSLVVCLLSRDPLRRLYEIDLIRELRSKMLGYLVGITSPEQHFGSDEHDGLFDEIIPAIAPQAPDMVRTPFEIVIPQLLGYHLSLSVGLNPDNPSPSGVINRVVQSFSIHLNKS
jgi:tagatose-6-phosphate ketose/aldose isomerase